jgi:hypothetical protein
MKLYTLPSSPQAKANKKKLVELLGEALVAGHKADKLLGSPMTRKQIEDMVKHERMEKVKEAKSRISKKAHTELEKGRSLSLTESPSASDDGKPVIDRFISAPAQSTTSTAQEAEASSLNFEEEEIAAELLLMIQQAKELDVEAKNNRIVSPRKLNNQIDTPLKSQSLSPSISKRRSGLHSGLTSPGGSPVVPREKLFDK